MCYQTISAAVMGILLLIVFVLSLITFLYDLYIHELKDWLETREAKKWFEKKYKK